MQFNPHIGLKKVPAVRLLAALITGILWQWYGGLPLPAIVVICITAMLLIIINALLPLYKKFQWQWLRGLSILVLFAGFGALLTYFNNIQNGSLWFGKNYTANTTVIATVDEPLVEKPNSYKAIVRITALQNKRIVQVAKGYAIVYFKKDSAISRLAYGSQIAFAKPLQKVQNPGNPGGFNYERYLLFQGITNQVYLEQSDYIILPQKDASAFQIFLQRTRNFVIAALQKNIPGKKEQGVAEALLIGYRNDLDKQLVQAYSNTGVVHIIAISGLHLGMIYAVLLWIFSPLKNRRWYRFTIPFIVLAVLWIFTFIAGAVPSITRSAVMFSFIVLGNCLQRKANIYNTLAISAFSLLLYNPFYLWDVGFQLSYAAVLSIVVFFKPVYNWLYIENKSLDIIWKLAATNIAAQIFTLPIVLYYFHQLPLLFLVTNLVVVPLSTLILFIEIVVVAAAPFTWLATITGKLTGWLLWLMNSFIEYIEKLPFAVWQNIKTDVFQALVLYVIILLLAAWLLLKAPKILPYALAATLVFMVYTTLDIVLAKQQNKLIVYNVPKCTAIDILQGNESRMLGNAALLQDNLLQNFYVKPSRVLYRNTPVKTNILSDGNYILHAGGKTILLINHSFIQPKNLQHLQLDAIVISGNPKLYISELTMPKKLPIIVFDNSNPLWKIERWKKDCDSLHLRCYSTAQQGAFIMNL